jgi:hypothetical protein
LWSVVATTSLDLAIISLPRCQAFFDTSVTMFVSSPSVVTKTTGVSITLTKRTLDVLVIIDSCHFGLASGFEHLLHPFC